jgi:hypothetical protein
MKYAKIVNPHEIHVSGKYKDSVVPRSAKTTGAGTRAPMEIAYRNPQPFSKVLNAIAWCPVRIDESFDAELFGKDSFSKFLLRSVIT